MRRLLVGLTIAVIVATPVGGAAFADVPAHTHQLQTPGAGDPSIAPGFCQEAAYQGFSQFHDLVHAANGFTGVMSTSEQVLISGRTLC